MAIDPSGTDPSLGNPIPEAVRRTMARTNAAARRAGVANVPDEDGVTPSATVVEKVPDQTPTQ